MMNMLIDTNFTMFSDTPRNRDPDSYSQTLCNYHLHLWNKPLPNGKMLSLTATPKAPFRLIHNSEIGEYRLSSDGIVHTYSRWSEKYKVTKIVKEIDSKVINDFYDLASTIGGYVIFPVNKVDNKPTINGIRGMHPKIGDRFDFTLECIRRWYAGVDSPLSAHLSRYNDFFRLFQDFRGYYKFFLLDDLVDSATDSIRFWLPFEDFGKTSPVPDNSRNEYLEYMENAITFTKARNARISEYSRQISQVLTDDQFITTTQSLAWTFAKTMPHIPHEYMVRNKTVDEDTYVTMYKTIEARGKYRDWSGTQYKYLNPGDGYKYWIMTDDIDESVIINRAEEGD